MAALVQTLQLATPQQPFATIVQGIDEPFLCFAGRLTAAVEKQVSDPTARKLMTQSVSQGNCNAACKRITETLTGNHPCRTWLGPVQKTKDQLQGDGGFSSTGPPQVHWTVGKDEARKPYKYDCLDSENVKPVSEIELKRSLVYIHLHRPGDLSSSKRHFLHWTAVLTKDRPETLCTVSMVGATPSEIYLRDLLDTGADVSILYLAAWPPQWPLTLAKTSIMGLGGTKQCYVSQNPVAITNPEGQTAIIWPHVTEIAQNLWGRDVLAAWGVQLGTDF
ncbi:hypothetical protein DUI87_01743 [Hirundo rustica rustica]|uniref:Peptidase A2 domain-containing protein n=1 Tax=Hirundo rustica rustica TaxID=333673 RepID=A0A3M0LCV6_HIRRU|nr:hypothetical protein DUI87_01743 [Hirundo rustica rustica]